MDGKKVLIVDDEPEFIELMKMRLEAKNCMVISSLNGKDAIKMIKNEKPDAVFLDILMPGIDGLELLKKIRKEDKNLPVFMLTAFSNEERFKLADRLGASGFIVKTSDLKEEVDVITDTLNLAKKYKGM